MTPLDSLRCSLSASLASLLTSPLLRHLVDRYHHQAEGLPPCDSPLHLLGQRYDASAPGDADATPDAALAFLSDWLTRPWLPYRRGFAPLPPTSLSSDAGWGCALRSGQMLLASALLTHTQGRGWRLGDAGSETHEGVLELFADAPEAPYGLHSLCAAGQLTPGAWTSPGLVCAALAAAAARAQPPSLRVHVLGGGGGAPTLVESEVAGCDEELLPTLLLVPLVLGTGRAVNPAYLPSLVAALAHPCAAGLLGGRAAASLFVAGCCGTEGLYLDPHTAILPPLLPGQAASCRCEAVRHLPLASLDPSLALAFLIPSRAALRGLCGDLEALAGAHPAAPLLTVGRGGVIGTVEEGDDW